MTIYDPTALRRELHEMPELALHEKRTSAYVAEKLKALGIETHENVGGSTGVVGIIRGTEPGPVFMLRADMDALPFVIDGKPCCIHACGHDGHTAMLLAAASRLKDKIKRGTLKLLFQPAEETLQGAPVIIKAGVIDDVDYALGAHIRPIQDVPAGMLCAAVRHTASTTLTIVIKGRGAHASRPHLGINAIDAACALMNGIQAIWLDPKMSWSAKATQIHADSGATNTVPDLARITYDCRAQTNELMDDLLAQIAQRSVEQRLEVVDVAPHECDVDRVGYVRNHRIPPREDRESAEVVRCRMLPVYRRIVQDVDAVDQTEGLAVAGRQRQIDLRAAVALDHVEIVEDRRLEDQRRRIFQIAQLTVYVELLRHSVKCFIESSTTQSCMQAFVREMSPSST